MAPEARTSVQVERRFAAHPKRVFDAWLDLAAVRAWFPALAGGGEVVRLDWRARSGVPFEVVVRRGQDEVAHVGEYLDVVLARRLVFTWVVPVVSKETMLVTVDLAPAPGAWGGTDLALKHERVVVAQAQGTEARWQAALDAIGAIVDPDAATRGR
jgi:uncharacterized protein YndB with AHSA1/START domain